MTWWMWVLVGFLLLGMELATTTLHLAFFGLGAIVVALVVSLGYGGPLWVQILMFTAISVVFLLFRKRLLLLAHYTPQTREIDTLVGETAVTAQEIGINDIGKAELRGTSWTARNVSERVIAAGERCRVERVEGLTLFVKPAS